ncbi:MAG: hypothetical protein KKE17_12005 [Proteobacteria bacterium]|nr:hypothetical protein [Pseudomonadota bacterium]MBU1710720.1 hypothetical protein [Pseudomonadota bacterium]
MDKYESLVLLADLENVFCELNHGKDAVVENHRACDYIVVPFGSKDSNDVATSVREMVIPVCRDCIDALQGDEWTLLYCFECSSSRWVLREVAKNQYRHHVLWLRGCPDCTSKFGGIYFNDFPEAVDVSLLTNIKVRNAA